MHFLEIKARIQALAAHPFVADVRTLRTDVEEAWTHYILKKLSDVFQSDAGEARCLSQCKDLFRETWLLIQGTSVSYTAMPDSELTRVLFDIASWVADTDNSVWRTKIREILVDHEKTCLELESNYLRMKPTCIAQVQALLEERWSFDESKPKSWTQNPATNLTTWAQRLEQQIEVVSGPDDVWKKGVICQLHDLTRDVLVVENSYQSARLALDKALQSHWSIGSGRVMPDVYDTSNPNVSLQARFKAIHESLQSEENYNAISIFMPGVWQGDTGDLSAANILRTHILSNSGKYLYPVSLIADVALMDALEARPNNPNYDDTRGDTDQQINTEEWLRLTTHSSGTEAVMQAKANYQKLSSQSHHLLGQLGILTDQLALNDAHGGRGTQKDAAGMAYPALINFRDYYQALPEEATSKIPTKLRDEIRLLLDVAFNAKSAIRANHAIQTCIGSRREALCAAIQGCEDLLAGISMGEGARQGLIQASIEAFNKAQDALKYALDNHTYIGRDNLGITSAVLEQFGITVHIESLNDMSFIVQGMEGQALAELLAQDGVCAQMIAQVDTLEDLVIVLTETSNTKLPILLHALRVHVCILTQTPKDLAAVLISLQVDKVDTVLRALAHDFYNIIRNIDHLHGVLKPLTSEQRTVVYEVMKEKLPNFIINSDDFQCVIKLLPSEQCTEVILMMKNKLSELITNIEHFWDVLRLLPSEQCTEVILMMKNKLPELITNIEHFRDVLRLLPFEQCTVVCEVMKEKQPNFIRNIYHLHSVLQILTFEQGMAVCEGMKLNHWFKIITCLNDFKGMLKFLSFGRRTEVIFALQNKLPEMIENGDDLEVLLKYLDEAQSYRLLDIMKGKLYSGMGKSPETQIKINNVIKGSKQGFWATPRAAKINVGGLEAKLKKYIEAYKEQFPYRWFGIFYSEYHKTKLNAAIYALFSYQNNDECLVKLQCLDVMPDECMLKDHYKNSYLLLDGIAMKVLYYIDYEGNSQKVCMKNINDVSVFFAQSPAQLTYAEVNQGLKDAVVAQLPTNVQLDALKRGLLGEIMVDAMEAGIVNGTKRPIDLKAQDDRVGVLMTVVE